MTQIRCQQCHQVADPPAAMPPAPRDELVARHAAAERQARRDSADAMAALEVCRASFNAIPAEPQSAHESGRRGYSIAHSAWQRAARVASASSIYARALKLEIAAPAAKAA